MTSWLRQVARVGQGLVEYALILALVAATVVVAIALMGRQIANAFLDVANTFQGP
jgi:Flp pilus assembly pilin Flp